MGCNENAGKMCDMNMDCMHCDKANCTLRKYDYDRMGKDVDLMERVRLKKANRENLYSLEPPFPKSNFLMELSNVCNHSCIFCAHQKMQRKVGKMSKEKAFDILQQAYDLGTREVGFYATGEPFLIPDLADYIAKAKEIGYTYVYLTSNGSVATPEKIRAVIDAGLDSIKFSINAPQRKLYEFIHGADDFDVVVEHLKYLNQYRRESGKSYKIYVTGILTRFTENLQDKYHEVFDGLCDQIVFKYVYNQGGYMPEIQEYLRCFCDTEGRRKCNLPFDAISVTQEGYLSIENADYENMLIVADLNKVSLKDGWYGDKMKDMRRRFMEDKLEGTLCDGCVHHTYAPAKPITPECSGVEGEYVFDDSLVKERIENSNLVVYVPMACDIIHPGHINIIKTAAKYGRVVVGLFTDEAIASYKRVPYMPYEQRKIVVENIKGVSEVIPQETRDYIPNVRKLQADFMVHGKDWREGPLAAVRQQAIDAMKEWGGQVIEPDYTAGVSSTMIQKKIVERAAEEAAKSR
jgi:cytidyltransferase-like protein